jgi:hypothetical protein
MSAARNVLILPLLALSALTGCVTGRHDAAVTDPVEKLRLSAAKLLKQNDADSLAAAAVLLYVDSRKTAITLTDEARARGPSRADLAWLQLRVCATTPGCDPTRSEADLRALDPTNSAAWIATLDKAIVAKDAGAIDTALAEMAKRDRFDIYVNPIVGHLSTAFANAQVKPLADAVTFVVGEGAAVIVPPFKNIGDVCKGEVLTREERLRSCRAIATSLSRGDALITRSFGAVMTMRTWPADSDQAKAAVEGRRIAHYRASTIGEIDAARPWTDQVAQDYVQILAANRSEEASARAQIVAAGRNPDPPPGWNGNAP